MSIYFTNLKFWLIIYIHTVLDLSDANLRFDNTFEIIKLLHFHCNALLNYFNINA